MQMDLRALLGLRRGVCLGTLPAFPRDRLRLVTEILKLDWDQQFQRDARPAREAKTKGAH